MHRLSSCRQAAARAMLWPLAVLLVSASPSQVLAQAQGSGGGGDGLRPFCPDRPTQATPPCTVDKGHFQVESDLFNVTYDRSGGVITDTYVFTNPTLKYGLTDSTDIEANLAPFEDVRIHTPGGGTQTISGIGDLVLRMKHHLFGNQTDGLNIAVEPFLQAPTSRRGIGDGAFEGGVLAPIQFPLTKSISMNLSPEIDVRKDMVGGGVHPAEIEIVNLSFSLPKNVTFSAEAYAQQDQDPMGVVNRCSADVALAWMLPHDLQLDVGANLGLNTQTAAVQTYVGVAHRF